MGIQGFETIRNLFDQSHFSTVFDSFCQSSQVTEKFDFRGFEANFDSEKYNGSIKNAITEIRILIRISKILIF